MSRLKDGIPVAPTDNVQLDTQGTLYSLSIATVTQEDAGTYECVARNKAGDDTCSAVLTVDGTSWSKSLKYCKAKFLYNADSSLQDGSKHLTSHLTSWWTCSIKHHFTFSGKHAWGSHLFGVHSEHNCEQLQ